jgi:Caspase domain
MPPAPPFDASIAVVVGINEYGKGIPSLRTAANDARRVAKTLADLHGYNVTEIIGAEATRDRITKLLTSELPARVGPNDRVLFYWAGHGVALDGDTGPNGYLLPADAERGDDSTFLNMPLVHDALLALSCRHMLIVLDSCFSGAFRWSGSRTIARTERVIHREKYERFVRDPAWQVITSASQDEEAFDQLTAGALGSRDGDGAHSPFAMALFHALEGSADVIGRDGLVTANELFVYLDEALQDATITAGKRQTPGLWPLRKHGKGQFVFFVPDRELTLPPAPPLTYESNPWRGLSSYEQSDAPLFFGRDASIESLTSVVIDRPFTVLLGPSGTGKSSLVKAGVLPRLDTSDWQILPVVRPGSVPIASLADAIATLEPSAPRPVDADQVADTVARWCSANPTRRLVLVIDQTEELITMARTPADRESFLKLLARLLDAQSDRLRIVLTLRTDFEPQFDHSALAERWKAARFVVKPMSRADLQAVIEEPAARSVLYFDPPELVDALLDEVTNMPGALPLLSFALSEMYVRYLNRRGDDRALTRDDYDQLGGVVGALRSRADEEYHALDAEHQATMERMLLRMVGGGSGNLARRRVSRVELVYGNPAENARVDRVRQQLVAARLLVEGREIDGDPYLEPAHDALVRAWGRLIQWIERAGADAIPLVTRQKLALEALEWRRLTHKATREGLLWKDPVRSAMLTPVVRDEAPWLNEVELEFARESVRGRQRARRVARGVAVLVGALGIVSFVLWRSSVSDANKALALEGIAKTAAEKAENARKDAVHALDSADKETKKAKDSEQNALSARALADTNAREARRQTHEAALAAQRAVAEKDHTVRSLFSSLAVYVKVARPGSVCVHPECGAPADSNPDAWIVLSRLPDTIPALTAPPNAPLVRDFIVAREFGRGRVVVYAHDAVTKDSELHSEMGDNLLVAQNALRWLAPTVRRSPECLGGVHIVLWEGAVEAGSNTALLQSFARLGWPLTIANKKSLAGSLHCADVFWFGNDGETPNDFATIDVPLIVEFVRNGGGLLVAGLGWSWAGHNATPPKPYSGDILGQPFGFRFTRDVYYPSPTQLLPLLSGPSTSRR